MTIAETSPYAWPFDARADPENMALLICGAIGYWSGHSPSDTAAEENIQRLRHRAAMTGMLTVLIEHQPPTLRTVPPSPNESSGLLRPTGAETTVQAVGIDGFYGSQLDPLLHQRGRSHLLIVGRCLETTVHSTLRRANDRGYECLTVVDACTALDPALRSAAVSSIEMSGGVFGAVGTTDAVLESRVSHHPRVDHDTPSSPQEV